MMINRHLKFEKISDLFNICQIHKQLLILSDELGQSHCCFLLGLKKTVQTFSQNTPINQIKFSFV
jgi:hypothetical protein